MSSTAAVHLNGAGSRFRSSMYAVIVSVSCFTLVTASRFSWRCVSSEKKRSTRFSQRGRRGREVEFHAGVLLQPSFHLRVLVRGVVVEDDVKIEVRSGPLLHLPHEAEELLVPVPGHAFVDHLPGGHIPRREQRRRPVPLVVVRHGTATALLERKAPAASGPAPGSGSSRRRRTRPPAPAGPRTAPPRRGASPRTPDRWRA